MDAPPDRAWNSGAKEKSLGPARKQFRFLDGPACSLFTIKTELPQTIILIIRVKMRTISKNVYLLKPAVIILNKYGRDCVTC
jgi:hypothetical protein